MSLLRRFPIMVLTLVLLSIVGFCAAEQNVRLLFIAVTLTALSWYVTEGPRGRTLPKWVSNLLVLAISLGVIVDLLNPPNEIAGVLGRFCVYLTLVKLYERRTARDHAHLMVLSLLLMIVGCLKSQALLFGVVLLLYAIGGLYTLLLYQLYAAHESTAVARRVALGATGQEPAGGVPRSPTLGRQFGLHFRGLATGIGVAGLALSVLLFLIFPRTLWSGLLGEQLRRHGPRTQVTGYTDEIDLDAGTRINQSRRKAFDVRIIDGDGDAMRPPTPLYLRGAVLDRYFDGQWTASGLPQRPVTTKPGIPTALARGTESAPIVTQVYRFSRGVKTIFALYMPISIETGGSHHLEFTPSTQILSSADADGPADYTIRSRPHPTDDEVGRIMADGAGPTPAVILYRLEISDDRRSVGDLSRSLLDRARVPHTPPAGGRWEWNATAAHVLQRYLQSNRFEYTLDLSDVVRGNTDPIVHFLLKTHRGHCEYFASALAVMCHSLDIDTRVVSGYVAGEYDEDAGRYIVREENAHAWVEVRTGEARYTVFDPTPPGSLPSATEDELGFADQLQWLYRRLEGNWNAQVIRFDGGSQTRLLDAIDASWSDRLAAVVRASGDWMARVNRAFNVGPGGYVWLGIVACALLIALVAAAKSIQRYRVIRRTLRLERIGFTDARSLRRQLGFYLDMLTELRRGGHPKPDWQPPLAFANALDPARPDVADLVRRISVVYYEARYSRRRLAGDEVQNAEGLVRELATVLRAGR